MSKLEAINEWVDQGINNKNELKLIQEVNEGKSSIKLSVIFVIIFFISQKKLKKNLRKSKPNFSSN